MPNEEYFAPLDYDTVMVSRSFAEFEEYRAELMKAGQLIGLKMAALGPHRLMPAGVIESSLKLVKNSAALAAIIGDRYGYVPEDPIYNPDELSLTELELNEAIRLKRSVLAFMTADYNPLSGAMFGDKKETVEKLEAFRSRIEANSLVHVFKTMDEFRTLAARALHDLRRHLDAQAEAMRESVESVNATASSSASLAADDSTSQGSQVNGGSTARPLLFISATHKDIEWRQLLERTLDNYNQDIEWWDDSKLEPGIQWETEIEAVMARAQIAVLLLSPDYLDSRSAIAEMARLRAQSKSGHLKLFPIVVRDCAWKDVPEIRAVQVWANGSPLENLAPRQRSDELNRIAFSILKLVGKTSAPSRQPPTEQRADDATSLPEFNFSKTAQLVLDKARSLATESGRDRITSSCVLFGFAESAGPERNSARFLRDMLETTGQYAKAFNTFLADSDRQQSDLVTVSIGMTSRNVASVLEYGRKIAVRVSLGSDTIHQRHLLAALLNPPGRKGKLKAHKRLKEMGIERSQYLGDFLEFIRRTSLNDNLAEWSLVLAIGPKPKATPDSTPSPFLEGPAGYTAEFCGVGGEGPVADYLFVGAHANRLAELIALRETKLPLAIGLFGNWGSGKSHFMNLMDRRLKALMKEEKERAPNLKQKWCREIVPIYFNAWHYLDTNLWASLVAQIFESLFTHLSPRGNDLEEVQRLLEKASGAAARAAEELAVAEKATEQAKKEFSVAEQNRLQAETVVDGLLHGLKSLLPEVTLKEVQKQSGELLGIEKEIRTIDDLRQVVEEAESLSAQGRALWKKLWKRPGRGWRLAWLTIVVLGGAAIAALTAIYLPGLKDWLRPVGRALATVLGGISALVLSLSPIIAAASRRLRQVEEWASKAETEQQRLRETKDVKEATLGVAAATAKEETARIQLAEAQTRENQLKEEALSLSPGRKLGRYIEERAQSSDYRGQLGLVSLARRDFQELSNLFADAEALQERVATLQLAQRAKENRAAELRVSEAANEEEEARQVDDQARGLEDQAKKLEDEGKRIEKLSKSIDRIVLFVDDLDRCQPEKIVEILQAVHLLLAFPLFAVVVGVDQRALRQSLRMQFKGLLTQDGQLTDRDEVRRKGQEPNERSATPLDYLEKIFHVPFHLPVMGKESFAELISKLTEPPKTESKAEATKLKAEAGKGEAVNAFPRQASKEPSIPVPFASEIAGAVLPSVPAKLLDRVVLSEERITPKPVVVQPVGTELIGSVPLHDWERTALRDYHTLIQTPRGATRLLNTYRLVRAGVPKQEWDLFSSGGEYRVAMLLLAAAAGYPASAREWFAELLKPDAEKTILAGEYAEDATLGWDQFKRVYKKSIANAADQSTQGVMAKWIERVETFTF